MHSIWGTSKKRSYVFFEALSNAKLRVGSSIQKKIKQRKFWISFCFSRYVQPIYWEHWAAWLISFSLSLFSPLPKQRGPLRFSRRAKLFSTKLPPNLNLTDLQQSFWEGLLHSTCLLRRKAKPTTITSKPVSPNWSRFQSGKSTIDALVCLLQILKEGFERQAKH